MQKAHYKRNLHLWLKTRLFGVYTAVFQVRSKVQKRKTSLP
nr:MAG TPA: hypothetical protein [Caudoviricetes sp.]